MTDVHKRALFVSAMAFMLFPWVAYAQNGGGQQDNPNEQAKMRQQGQQRQAMLAQRLNLTDDQKRLWAQINRETAQAIREARKDDTLNEEQMQAQLKEIHKEHNQRLLAMLSPDQQQELKAFWDEQKQKQRDKASGNNNSNPDPSFQTSKDKGDDDLFAGMVPDPDPVPPPAQKKQGPK